MPTYLRKAMGKKDRATLNKMKGKFLEGTAERGFDSKVCDKIWTDWEAFAQYAFNKSAQHLLRFRSLPDRMVERPTTLE
jgi:DNA polymerase III alpha subunit